jgi:AcrR family transcriptional regulator
MTGCPGYQNEARTAVPIGRPRAFDAEQALDRAMKLFWRHGYEGTSLSDLTQELGISRPSLYATFGNKQQLFLKAFARYEEQAGAYRIRAQKETSARAFARQLLKGAISLHTDRNNPPGCLGVQGALVCGDAADPVRRELIARRTMGFDAIRIRLERARAEGDLGNADPSDLARFLSATIYGIIILSIDGASQKELTRLAETALRAWPTSATPHEAIATKRMRPKR